MVSGNLILPQVEVREVIKNGRGPEVSRDGGPFQWNTKKSSRKLPTSYSTPNFTSNAVESSVENLTKLLKFNKLVKFYAPMSGFTCLISAPAAVYSTSHFWMSALGARGLPFGHPALVTRLALRRR